jgi:hypothetical protein
VGMSTWPNGCAEHSNYFRLNLVPADPLSSPVPASGATQATQTATPQLPIMPSAPSPRSSREPGEEASSNPVVNDPWWSRRRLWLRRFITGESKLDILAAEVQLGWRTSDPQIRDLLISLEAKWQASHEEARRAGTTSVLSFLGGLAALFGSVYVLWLGRTHSYDMIVELSQRDNVDHVLMWQVLLISSGSVLLLVGIATLLLRVADRNAHLARQHGMDADGTRRIEAAVRLTMAFGKIVVPLGAAEQETKAIIQTAKNYSSFALKLLEGTPDKWTTPPDLSALPDAVRELVETIAKVSTAAKGGKGD